MDGEADPPDPEAHARHLRRAHDSLNPPLLSSSSTTDFMRNVQAAYKRHRPLVSSRSGVVRPIRVQHSQHDDSTGADFICDGMHDANMSNDFSSSYEGDTSGGSTSSSRVLDSAGTIENAVEKNSEKSSSTENQTEPHRQVNEEEGSDGKMADEKGSKDCLSSQLSSLALAEEMEQNDVNPSAVMISVRRSNNLDAGPRFDAGVPSSSSSSLSTSKVIGAPDHLRHLSPSSESIQAGSTCITTLGQSRPSANAVFSRKEKDGPPTRKKNCNPDLFFKVNGKLYQRLGKIGSGGSSEVHKVISTDCTIYALKKIKLRGRDYGTAFGFCQEIEYLSRLRGKDNIIQLVDYEVTDKNLLEAVTSGGNIGNREGKVKEDGYIYMVLEHGEIDLAHMLSQKWKQMDGCEQMLDDNWLRFYWQQILQAVKTIHEERIVHSDLKPANFLLVKGSLKLIDFGIAKAIMCDTTNIQRDSQVGTLSYMSPEAFMCNERDASGNTIKCGRSSDIWSLGCILYQMVYGRTPFSEYKTFWAKFRVITDRSHEIAYPPVPNPYLLDLMRRCLAWDRDNRWRIPELLRHPFLVPQVPSALPFADDRDSASALLSRLRDLLDSSPSFPRDVFRERLLDITRASSRLLDRLDG